MDQQQATEFIIRELGKRRSHNEIIREICEQTGWPWKKVRHFVRRVEVQHQDQIVTRQSPLPIMLGIGSIVGGILLIVGALFAGLAIYFVVVGLGMIIGGVAGIWRAISLLQESR